MRVDGELQTHHTHSRTVAGVLSELGLQVGSNDRLFPAADEHLTWQGDRVPSISIETARSVLLTVPQSSQQIYTAEQDATNILRDANLDLYPGDRISVDGLPAGAGIGTPFYVDVDPAIPISLSLDGRSQIIHSAAPTLGEALWESGIHLYAGDQLFPPADTPLTGATEVSLVRAQDLVIELGELDLLSRTAEDSVGEALAAAGVQLVGLDYSIPGSAAPLPVDGAIRVVRVRETVQMDQVPLPFETRYQPVDGLEIDSQNLVQPGEFGGTGVHPGHRSGRCMGSLCRCGWRGRGAGAGCGEHRC